jgi:two-component system sensor histidine kinase BaeS
MRSLRLRLLAAMTLLPVGAVAAVWLTLSQLNPVDASHALSFTVVPLSRSGGGPRVAGDDADSFRPEATVAVGEGIQPVVYRTADDDGFVIQASPEFVEAVRADQEALDAAQVRRLTITAGAAAAVAVVLAFLTWRRISGPVHALTRAAHALEAGDLASRAPVAGRDELGTLSHAFNAMAERIERDTALRRRMTSDIAHELRTPLNNLAGFADALADGVVAPAPAAFASLQEEVAILTRLVADLEQLALGDSGGLDLQVEEIDLAEVAANAIQSVTPRASDAGVAVGLETSACVPVRGDPARLGQVARNLLENAVRHTPAGGRVRVSVRELPTAVSMSVEDNGPGIAPEHLPFIFERLYRADPARAKATGGSGLGLAIARQLVEAHGGTISAGASALGGARFSIELPHSTVG